MRWRALLALAATAAAQDLPPGVLTLARIKTHIRQEMKRLPDCTCLQTVRRFQKPARGAMSPVDTVRLEILFTGTRELYSSPGGNSFIDQHPTAFVSSGTMSDGMFAIFVKNLFVEEAAMFTYRGEEDLAGRRVVKYDYRIPQFLSGYLINLPEGRGMVGMKGSVWADPASFDLVHLEVHADEIPPQLPIEDVVDVMNYARVQVGDATILLPERAEVRLIRLGGEETLNLVDLTHCRSFAAESTIRTYTDADALAAALLRTNPSGPTAKTIRSEGQIPAGLLVTVRLKTAVTDQSAVGSLVEGVVAGEVRTKTGVVAPDGAVVHGRIRRLERSAEPSGYFVVGLEFTEIEAAESRLRFFADLQHTDAPPGVEWTVSKPTSATGPMKAAGAAIVESSHPNDLPGVGSFFVKGSRFVIPAGAKFVWKTSVLPK